MFKLVQKRPNLPKLGTYCVLDFILNLNGVRADLFALTFFLFSTYLAVFGAYFHGTMHGEKASLIVHPVGHQTYIL